MAKEPMLGPFKRAMELLEINNSSEIIKIYCLIKTGPFLSLQVSLLYPAHVLFNMCQITLVLRK